MRYMSYVRRGGSRLKAEREMHKQLEQKHEYARIEAVGVEHTLEMLNPPWRYCSPRGFGRLRQHTQKNEHDQQPERGAERKGKQNARPYPPSKFVMTVSRR